jgi:hypothetical protein
MDGSGATWPSNKALERRIKINSIIQEVSYIDAHRGLAGIGFTYTAHFIWIIADAAEPLIERPSRSGPAVFLTC